MAKKYIEAEELLKRLNARKYSVEKTTRRQVAYNAAISDACRSVDMMPAADVQEVKHGRWIMTDGYPHKVYCSECYATLIPNVEWFKTYNIASNYCPNCGASMDEVTYGE